MVRFVVHDIDVSSNNNSIIFITTGPESLQQLLHELCEVVNWYHLRLHLKVTKDICRAPAPLPNSFSYSLPPFPNSIYPHPSIIA